MRLARHPGFIVILFGLLVAVSRYPLVPGQLFTFDDVNLALAAGDFDIRLSQPQPPGYPLFVMEMRVLSWMRVRRPEHLLPWLAMAGSLAALVLLALAGNRFLGRDAGYCAAWLMALHPAFWHEGVTSALRVQMAIVSLAVAAACWRAWTGEGRWVLWSALVLGAGAGMRPEMGVLLFPLWAMSAWRAPISWRDRRIALGAMAAVVALWLLPAVIASGGPASYVQACLGYLGDQASVSSALFGASEHKWRTTFWRLMVWVFCGMAGVVLPAVLAWRRVEWWGAGRERLAFLALWFVPAFVFAILVHVEDPGQTLAMVPVVSLAGGYIMARALDNVDARVSRWHTLALVVAALVVAWMVDRHEAPFILVWLPVVCLALGLALRLAQVANTGYPPRALMMAFFLCPIIILNLAMFNHQGWYFRGTAASGFQVAAEGALEDMVSGLALASREQIENTLGVDDHTIRQVKRLAAERPGNTVVVWEEGLTSWRKVAYYVPGVPVAVLEHRKIRPGSPAVIATWKGARLMNRLEGAAPLAMTVPAGGRIVWVLNPASDFYRMTSLTVPLRAAVPVYYTDLPQESGSWVLGEYRLTW